MIEDHHTLTSLIGLNNLNEIGEFLSIEFNDSLSSLIGLDKIDAARIYGLYFGYNNVLSHCDVESICQYLASPKGTIDIRNNKTGCNSQQEVEDACVAINVEPLAPEPSVIIFPNPAFTILAIQTHTNGSLSIHSINGHQLITCQITEQKTQLDISSLPSGMYIIQLTGNNTVSTSKFIKQ